MFNTNLRALTLVLAVCVSAACASLVPTPRRPPVGAGTADDTFGFSGRIAVQENDHNLSGGIRWSHDAAGDDILLLSPLGQGVAEIASGAEGATLRTRDDKFYRASDAEQLARDVTGWRIPVSGLVFWVRGMARPGGTAHEKRDRQGRLLRLEQEEWQIEYADYFDPPDASLPRHIVLRRPEFELKLVIDSWERPDGTGTSSPNLQ